MPENKDLDDLRKSLIGLKNQEKKLLGVLSDAKSTKDQKLVSYVSKSYNKVKQIRKKTEYKLKKLKEKQYVNIVRVSSYGALKGSKGVKQTGVFDRLKDKLNPSPEVTLALSVSVIALTATVASVVIYKKFFSQAARACKDSKGIEKEKCITRYKIAGYEAAIKSLTKDLSDCSQTKDPYKCKSKIQDKILLYGAKIRSHKKKLQEGSMNFVDGYLEYLNEDRGINLPIERDEKPNYIRMCMVQEDDRVKIRCLRKIKELTAMNPFYQYRIDRFIDAITNTYEATPEPGFHEYKLEEMIQHLQEKAMVKNLPEDLISLLMWAYEDRGYYRKAKLKHIEKTNKDAYGWIKPPKKYSISKDTKMNLAFIKTNDLIGIYHYGNGDYAWFSFKNNNIHDFNHELNTFNELAVKEKRAKKSHLWMPYNYKKWMIDIKKHKHDSAWKN